MMQITSVTVKQCMCDLCGHDWQTLSLLPPRACPKCFSRQWNGAKARGRPKKDKKRSKARFRGKRPVELRMPKPQRVRMEEL